MPVTGITQVKQNMKRVFKDISDKKAPQFVHNILAIGWTASREFTPIEYSNLVNSVTMWTEVNGNKVSGELMYNANYAAALEFGVWRPRPVSMKEGPAANMDAKPHFLREGFESPESKAAIKQAQEIFKI